MKAIKTIYKGPTNHQGSRILATDCDGNKVTVAWDHELDARENHRGAAKQLCIKMRWPGEFATGSFPDCYVHVFTGRK